MFLSGKTDSILEKEMVNSMEGFATTFKGLFSIFSNIRFFRINNFEIFSFFFNQGNESYEYFSNFEKYV